MHPLIPRVGSGIFLCKYSDTLLLHLRLHDFGKKYEMEPLSIISLYKLLNTLDHLPLEDEGDIKVVTRLFELASASGTESEIFKMMLHYVSSHLQLLNSPPRSYLSLGQQKLPLNPICRSRSLAQGYIHRNVIYQTLACSDKRICPDSDQS